MEKNGKRRHESRRSSYLLRRFSVFYLVFAVIPFLLLFFLYMQFDPSGYAIHISRSQLTWLIMLVGIAALLGFFGVRSVLSKFVRLAEDMRRSVLGKVDRAVIMDLAKEEGEVAELAKSFSEVFNRLEANIRQLEETKKTLHDVVSKVSRALSSMENFDQLIQLVLETSVNALGATEGAIFSMGGDESFVCKAWVGPDEVPEKEIVKAAGSALAWVSREHRIFVLPALGGEERNGVLSPPVACAPLFCRGRIWGAVCLSGNRFGKNFTEDELKIVSNLSYQVAIAFENAQLTKDMERTYFETMSALALAVEARDPCSRGHAERVGEYSTLIARKLGLPRNEVQALADAARLHDIGKIGIDDRVLQKPARLDDTEWEVMRKHPLIGENIVMPLKTFHHLLEPIRHHHERLDGSGYPDGLAGDDIPLNTRIMAVADMFDAMASDRPYREAFSLDTIRQQLSEEVAAGRIDERVVQTLCTLLDEGAIAVGNAENAAAAS